jgi:hypothetical protein
MSTFSLPFLLFLKYLLFCYPFLLFYVLPMIRVILVRETHIWCLGIGAYPIAAQAAVDQAVAHGCDLIKMSQ